MFSRYMAICHPLSPHARASTGQAKKTILKIWLVSFATAAPWAQYTQVISSPLSLVEIQLSFALIGCWLDHLCHKETCIW